MNRGTVENRLQRLHRGVEALQMADLQDAPRAARRLDQALALRDGRGHRLLDQHVRAGLEKLPGDRVVQRGRRDDAHRLDAAQKLAIVGVRRHAELGGHRRARRGRRIGDADELASSAALRYFCA